MTAIQETDDDLGQLEDELETETVNPDNPELDVTMQDGRKFHVRVISPDLARWDLAKARKDWPDFRDAPMLWLTFVGWVALKRTGDMQGVTFEAFLDTLEDISQERVPGPPANPTPEALPPGK